MRFQVHNQSLISSIATAVRGIYREIFTCSAPPCLHHYTRANAVQGITESRSLWATCIQDQADKTEISYSSELVAGLAEEISSSGIPPFASDILRRLPFFMEERKNWIFIACFCDDQNSRLHWTEYGDYCLTFPAPWTGAPALALGQPRADCWYQPVVYEESVHQDAIDRALRAIVLAVTQNTAGRNEGAWAQAMLDMCARNVAQLLLGLIVGFKRNSFKAEREWRIICAPRLGSNNSAPTSIDQDFAVNVKRFQQQRYIPLQIQQPYVLSQPLFIAQVPFNQLARNPSRTNAQEIESINDILIANHRADLTLAECAMS